MPICAIYARVSDEDQVKGESIEHQISFVREFVRRRSTEENEIWVTPDVHVYVDEGITGTSFIKREAVQRLISGAQAKKFDIVLFKGISRFARDTVDALVMMRTLLANGVRIISLEENFDSCKDNAEFIFTIHSALAQAESEKIAIRVRIGAVEKAKSGRWNSMAPDGYVLNRQSQKLEIDPATAPMIQRIYHMALEGYGPWSIADKLNTEGLYTPRGKEWTRKRIRGILSNPVYIGDVVYGRREKRLSIPDGNDPLSRKKRTVFVNHDDQILTCRNAHPSIVDRDMFNLIQDQLVSRSTRKGKVGHHRLLTKGILVCKCERNMTVKHNHLGYVYYVCSGKLTRGNHYCNQRFLRVLDLETAVLDRLRADVQAAINMDSIHIVQNMPAKSTKQDLYKVNQQIEREMVRSQLLFDRYSDGSLSNDQFTKMNQTIRQRILSFQQIRLQLDQRQKHSREEIDVGSTVKKVIDNFLSTRSTDQHVTRQFIETLIERIQIINSTPNDVQLRITYRFANKLSNCVVQ